MVILDKLQTNFLQPLIKGVVSTHKYEENLFKKALSGAKIIHVESSIVNLIYSIRNIHDILYQYEEMCTNPIYTAEREIYRISVNKQFDENMKTITEIINYLRELSRTYKTNSSRTKSFKELLENLKILTEYFITEKQMANIVLTNKKIVPNSPVSYYEFTRRQKYSDEVRK